MRKPLLLALLTIAVALPSFADDERHQSYISHDDGGTVIRSGDDGRDIEAHRNLPVYPGDVVEVVGFADLGMEAIYDGMHAGVGLSAFADTLPAEGGLFSARHRVERPHGEGVRPVRQGGGVERPARMTRRGNGPQHAVQPELDGIIALLGIGVDESLLGPRPVFWVDGIEPAETFAGARLLAGEVVGGEADDHQAGTQHDETGEGEQRLLETRGHERRA